MDKQEKVLYNQKQISLQQLLTTIKPKEQFCLYNYDAEIISYIGLKLKKRKLQASFYGDNCIVKIFNT